MTSCSKTAQWQKNLDIMSDNLSSIPGTPVVEKDKKLLQVALCVPHGCPGMCVHASLTYMLTKCKASINMNI